MGTRRLVVLAAVVATGCSATGLRGMPKTAAAHAAAIEPPPRPVALSVLSDPPLPGEPPDGWPDLGRVGSGHQHH